MSALYPSDNSTMNDSDHALGGPGEPPADDDNDMPASQPFQPPDPPTLPRQPRPMVPHEPPTTSLAPQAKAKPVVIAWSIFDLFKPGVSGALELNSGRWKIPFQVMRMNQKFKPTPDKLRRGMASLAQQRQFPVFYMRVASAADQRSIGVQSETVDNKHTFFTPLGISSGPAIQESKPSGEPEEERKARRASVKVRFYARVLLAAPGRGCM